MRPALSAEVDADTSSFKCSAKCFATNSEYSRQAAHSLKRQAAIVVASERRCDARCSTCLRDKRSSSCLHVTAAAYRASEIPLARPCEDNMSLANAASPILIPTPPLAH